MPNRSTEGLTSYLETYQRRASDLSYKLQGLGYVLEHVRRYEAEKSEVDGFTGLGVLVAGLSAEAREIANGLDRVAVPFDDRGDK